MARLITSLVAVLFLLSGVGSAQVAFSYTFHDVPQIGSGVASGDFNRDGRPDLAMASGSTDPSFVSVWLGTGGGKFGTRADYAIRKNPGAVKTADLNGDGKLDLMVSHGGSNVLSILLGNGDGTFRPGPDLVMAHNVSDFAFGDFNRDGAIDVAVLECDASSICDMQAERGNNTATFTPGYKIQMTGFAFSLNARDLNRDGNIDLVMIRTNEVVVFGGDGTGRFPTFTHFAPPKVCTTTSCADRLTSVVPGDFDNDGTLELAVLQGHFCGSACGSNTVYIYENNSPPGSFSFPRANSFNIARPAGGFLVPADMNGDQNIDLIAASGDHFGGYSVLALGKGNNTFGAVTGLGGLSEISDVQVRDVSLDSRHDVMVGSWLNQAVAVGLNTNGSANCTPPNSANLAAKICSPAANASVASPVVVKGSGNSPAGVLRLEVWIDGVKKYDKWNDQVSKSFALSAGSHRITLVAVDLYKGTAKTSRLVNVQ